MAIDNETGFEAFPELEQEEEAVTANGDDRPVSSTPHDWTISTLRDKYERNQIDLQPPYQRQYVWNLKPELPSRLIESLLLEIPIPPIYFGRVSGSKLEVIDGQQRLTTLIRFVRNEFRLERLQRLSSLNGKYFKDLSEDHQSQIMDAPIRSVVIDAGSNHNLRYEVFERLNRGSMALNEQELRNCVYRGPFCDLLAKLEKDSDWRKVKGGNEPEPRFVEREIILRFFAFANRIEYYGGNLKRFLNEYMGIHAPTKPEQLVGQEAMFKQAMRNVYNVFGEHAGRLYSAGTEDRPAVDGNWETKFSVSAFDIQASALLNLPPGKVQAAAEQIREAYIFYLLTNPHVRLAISRQPAGTNATRTRWFGFKAEVQRLLDAALIEPRFFPYALRRQLYESNPVCLLCGNEIHSFDDSTVDHIHPYSKGGRTIPENAQLAHRSCNARKCANISAAATPSVSQSPPVISTALASTPNPFPSISVKAEPINSQSQKQVGSTLTSATKPNRQPPTLRKKRLSISLYDLIRAGLIKPPFTLEKTFKGLKLLACVEQDGRVTWNNTPMTHYLLPLKLLLLSLWEQPERVPKQMVGISGNSKT